MKFAKLNILVEFEHENPLFASKEISPLRREDGSIDELAVAEFDDFATEVYAVLDRNGYDELEPYHESNNTDSESRYFTMYKSEDSTETSIKCVVYIRVSDHYLDKSRDKYTKKYHAGHTKDIEQKIGKKISHWKAKNIVVNNKTFNSYDEAIEYIKRIVPTW